jgi:hypothetical protein
LVSKKRIRDEKTQALPPGFQVQEVQNYQLFRRTSELGYADVRSPYDSLGR